MSPAAATCGDRQAIDALRQLESRLASVGREELSEALAPVIRQFNGAMPPAEAAAAAEAALAFCRRLYANARSGDALPLARAVLAQAVASRSGALERRAATACGLLAADTADVVGAVEYHVRALRLAGDDRVEASGVWNNIGLAMGIAGNYDMAAKCYQRALQLAEGEPQPVYSRYMAYMNLAHAQLQLERVGEGLECATRALREQTRAFREADLHSALLLERNVVRLLVAANRPADAQAHVEEATALSERLLTPRAIVAAATTRAVFELARGQTDVALTRLEQALDRARLVPAALRDTLACVVDAEETAGHSERALLRLGELSDHVYRSAVDRARRHVDLANVAGFVESSLDRVQAQARARLVSKVGPSAQPEGWTALDRLAVSAVLRMDPTGWHGKRVGTLCKALAMAVGFDPLRALELGLAAEVHDIGMLSVPDEVFGRKDAAAEEDPGLIRRHVEGGAEILGDDRHPRVFLAREIVRYHHARWDGTGYPERVAGRFIPVGARICAVVDAYDAMVSGLEGRPRKGMDDALAQLHREAGKRLDPQLVASFDALIRTESEDLGMDIGADSGMEGFQELVNALQEDRGFV
jgi:putative two-component system response regulator